MKCKVCKKEAGMFGGRNRTYCSSKCHRDYWGTLYKKTFKPKKCAFCDVVFTPRSILNKFCSQKCSHEVQKRKRWKKSFVKKCDYCESEFNPYSSMDKYCSANCRIENQKSKRSKRWNKESVDKIKGKGNPSYRNGYYSRGKVKSQKGHKFYMRVRDKMRADMVSEYGHLFCERCGINHTYQWEMHHLIYRSEKPKHRHLHDEKNLINLCMKCHNWFHAKKSRRNELIEKRNLVELFGTNILRT